MNTVSRKLFWLILAILISLGAFLWSEHPDFLSAKSLTELIGESSAGGVDATGTTQLAPLIPGYTAEEKVDRGVLNLINIILYICGTAAGVMIIVGGIRYILSAGNDDGMKAAKSTILWACGGLLATFLAWAAVLNIVRIGSTGERLDNSSPSGAGECGPNVTMFCKNTCCGCSSNNSESRFGCNEGLQCGGPMDVIVFRGVSELQDRIRVCQPPPEPGA